MSCQLLVNAQTGHVTPSTGLINELIGIQVAAANLLLSALLLLFGQSKAINKRRKSRGPLRGFNFTLTFGIIGFWHVSRDEVR